MRIHGRHYESEKADRDMTVRSAIARLTDHEELNFLLTNRVPRRLR